MRNTPLKAFANDDDKKKKVNANIKKELERLKKSQELKEEHQKYYNEHIRKRSIIRGNKSSGSLTPGAWEETVKEIKKDTN